MFAKEFQKIITSTALALMVLMLTIPNVFAAGPTAGDDGVTFALSDQNAQAVFVAGDFNGWSAADLALANDGTGNWTVTVVLAAGTYEYKFVVDGDWREDPGNAEKKSDPFGGSNSVITVKADGGLAGGTAAVAAPVAQAPATVNTEDIKVGAPLAVDGGIAFTYRDGGASHVTLAGTFNGWNADEWPLSADGKGNWLVVKKLDAGQYEYKFVVDGNWLADPENPDTLSDPYGGVNSAITVDAQGQLTATEAGAAAPVSNNTLNAKVTIDGRYLTRFQFAKNVGIPLPVGTIVDPRWRLQRPTQSVDLNFNTEVSDMARTFMRMRLDSDQNIIQNNVAAFLDEANLQITPENFTLNAYWNQEVFTGEDLLSLGGDVDLPGTIMHDHLDYGKGTAGVLFEAVPRGVKTRLFFANAHNFDYYNDPDLFDNLGQDRISLRFSKQFGKFEIGTPVYAERALVWLNFGDIISQTDTGIPVLNDHIAATDDKSDWYEVDNYLFAGGLDLRYQATKHWSLGLEALFRDTVQRIATGNHSGQDSGNGSLELPLNERDELVLVGQLEYDPSPNSSFKLQHQSVRMDGGNSDERLINYTFADQAEANKKILFNIGAGAAVADLDSTELTWNWQRDDHSATVWLRRASRDFDYGVVGLTAPSDSTVTSFSEEIWYLAGSIAGGSADDRFGHYEFEAGFNLADRGVSGLKQNQLEMIFRYDRDLTRNVGLIADLRFTRYHLEGQADGTTGEEANPDYFNPFVGFRYAPIRKLELVLAYGVDPIEYSIDYGGRQLGRWFHRQNYLFDNPDATILDAENNLKNARVITLRAQLLF